jgi:hypothetical protein
MTYAGKTKSATVTIFIIIMQCYENTIPPISIKKNKYLSTSPTKHKIGYEI